LPGKSKCSKRTVRKNGPNYLLEQVSQGLDLFDDRGQQTAEKCTSSGPQGDIRSCPACVAGRERNTSLREELLMLNPDDNRAEQGHDGKLHILAVAPKHQLMQNCGWTACSSDDGKGRLSVRRSRL